MINFGLFKLVVLAIRTFKNQIFLFSENIQISLAWFNEQRDTLKYFLYQKEVFVVFFLHVKLAHTSSMRSILIRYKIHIHLQWYWVYNMQFYCLISMCACLYSNGNKHITHTALDIIIGESLFAASLAQIPRRFLKNLAKKRLTPRLSSEIVIIHFWLAIDYFNRLNSNTAYEHLLKTPSNFLVKNTEFSQKTIKQKNSVVYVLYSNVPQSSKASIWLYSCRGQH